MTETPTDGGRSDAGDGDGDGPERLVMADVRHEPPNAGTSRTYERGNEGRDEPQRDEAEEEPEYE
jgi:hypothetical protein